MGTDAASHIGAIFVPLITAAFLLYNTIVLNACEEHKCVLHLSRKK
jgi:hypothetical protein